MHCLRIGCRWPFPAEVRVAEAEGVVVAEWAICEAFCEALDCMMVGISRQLGTKCLAGQLINPCRTQSSLVDASANYEWPAPPSISAVAGEE